jgi:hypothetical protein
MRVERDMAVLVDVCLHAISSMPPSSARCAPTGSSASLVHHFGLPTAWGASACLHAAACADRNSVPLSPQLSDRSARAPQLLGSGAYMAMINAEASRGRRRFGETYFKRSTFAPPAPPHVLCTLSYVRPSTCGRSGSVLYEYCTVVTRSYGDGRPSSGNPMTGMTPGTTRFAIRTNLMIFSTVPRGGTCQAPLVDARPHRGPGGARESDGAGCMCVHRSHHVHAAAAANHGLEHEPVSSVVQLAPFALHRVHRFCRLNNAR